MANKVFEPDSYKKFLSLASRFPNMSIYNLILLSWQFEEATIVAGQNAWKDNYNIDVKEDEQAICLLKPELLDDVLDYKQIGVFDISQLERKPEIKKENYSIVNFFGEKTALMLSYDFDNMLEDKEYMIVDDEIFVNHDSNLSKEENDKNADKSLLCAYVDKFCDLESNTMRDKAIKDSVKFILYSRYDLPIEEFSFVYIANCKDYSISFLTDVVNKASSIIYEIENNITIELNFADIAFINLLIQAESQDDFENIMEFDVEDDVLKQSREDFVEKMMMISSNEFNKIVEDRSNNKMLTQPPYKIKLIEEF